MNDWDVYIGLKKLAAYWQADVSHPKATMRSARRAFWLARLYEMNASEVLQRLGV